MHALAHNQGLTWQACLTDRLSPGRGPVFSRRAAVIVLPPLPAAAVVARPVHCAAVFLTDMRDERALVQAIATA
eukprot:5291589-Alexandrium_andersonii.AAC.1